MPPSWARASTMSTPGNVGRPGKWPVKNASSPVRCHRPRADTPGTTSSTSSTKRNGGRWGRTSSGRTVERLLDRLFQPLEAERLLAVDQPHPLDLLAEAAVEQRAEDHDRLCGAVLPDLLGHVEAVPLGH